MRNLLMGCVGLLTMVWAMSAFAAEKDSGVWKYLFDGRTLQVAEGAGVFRAVDGRIEAAGPGGRLVLGTDLERAALRGHLENGAFLLEMEVLTEPGADCGLVIPMPAIPNAVEVRIHNGATSPARKPEDLAKTGSLTGLRNQFKSIVGDGQWFKLGVAVHGPRRETFCRPIGSGALGYFVMSCGWRVQVMVNGILVADYQRAGRAARQAGGRIPAFARRDLRYRHSSPSCEGHVQGHPPVRPIACRERTAMAARRVQRPDRRAAGRGSRWSTSTFISRAG